MTRRIDESILVNRDIEITVVDIRGDKVRLGITAPREVPIHRREVYEAIHGLDGAAPFAHDGFAAEPAEASSVGAVQLTDALLSFLDRLNESIRERSGAEPRREQTLLAILSAIQEAEEAVGEPATLEHLKSTLASAIKATAPSK